jgi:hypothetical protein
MLGTLSTYIQRLSQVVNGPGSRIGLYFRVVGTHDLGAVPSFYSCQLSHGVGTLLAFPSWLPSFALPYRAYIGFSPSFPILNVRVCVVAPQSLMMRRIVCSCVNTPHLLRLEICS